jgi:hypothetical protein
MVLFFEDRNFEFLIMVRGFAIYSIPFAVTHLNRKDSSGKDMRDEMRSRRAGRPIR